MCITTLASHCIHVAAALCSSLLPSHLSTIIFCNYNESLQDMTCCVFVEENCCRILTLFVCFFFFRFLFVFLFMNENVF